MILFNVQVICFIIIANIFKLKIEKIDFYTIALYFLLYVLIYGSSFHDIQIGILFIQFFLPILLFSSIRDTVIILFLNGIL